MVITAERKKLNRSEINKSLVELKRKLISENIPVVKTILFGSYAKGYEHIDSDIDVAIVLSPRISSETKRKIRQIPWWAKQINIKLEPHILSTADLKNRYFSIVGEINKCA